MGFIDLVQVGTKPFFANIIKEVELSFIFIGGELSHALVKKSASGDYRIQSMYGGIEEPIKPSQSVLKCAKNILDLLDE